MQPDAAIVEKVEDLVGARPISWHRATGGYTVAGRWIVAFNDGSTAFVKVATDNQTAGWLRQEMKIYGGMRARFLPSLLCWCDGERPLLVLEDLSRATWASSWTAGRINGVLGVIDELRAAEPPPDVPALTELAAECRGWQEVADDPLPFLKLTGVSPEWLGKALPELIAAERSVQLDGNSLVHLDIRSDNICFDGARTVLVDWNWAHRGNANADMAFWLPTLHREGGPPPWNFDFDDPAWIAVAAGYFAARAPKPAHAHTSAIRQLQLDNFKAALPWAIRALGLPPVPDRV